MKRHNGFIIIMRCEMVKQSHPKLVLQVALLSMVGQKAVLLKYTLRKQNGQSLFFGNRIYMLDIVSILSYLIVQFFPIEPLLLQR